MKKFSLKLFKKGLSFRALFRNNKVVFAFSIVLAFCFWLYISVFQSDNGSAKTKISDIPIDIQLSEGTKEKGLSAFLEGDATASVEVEGNSMTISTLKKYDMEVVASDVSELNTKGTYEVFLMAKPNDNLLGDISVNQDSLSPKKVKVLIDRFKQEEFTIQGEINYKTNLNYFSNTVELNPSKVMIAGPETIVSKVVKVGAKHNISQELTSSAKFETQLAFYDSNGNMISDSDLNKLTISSRSAEGSIDVMKKSESELDVNLVNAPKNFDKSRIKINPAKIDIACPQSSTDELRKLSLGNINFAGFDLSNYKMEMPVELPQGYKNLSNAYSATVTIDTQGLASKVVEAKNIEFVNVEEGKKAKSLTNSFNIQVNGPASEIEKIGSDNIKALVNLENKKDLSGHMQFPVSFEITGFDGSWVSGSYNISATIE